MGVAESGADIPRVERTRHDGVFGALEDGAAVGEDGHFVRGDAETKKKIILANVFDNGCQPQSESAEIHGPAVFVNLHGIPAAKGDVGLGISSEKREITLRAGAAVRIASHADRLHVPAPHVAREQPAMKSLWVAREELQGFGDFE